MDTQTNLTNVSAGVLEGINVNLVTISFTSHQTQLFLLVNYIILCGSISMFGIITNVINMVIFYRQGLNTTTNISFFALAVSDLCCLVTQQLFNFYINPVSRRLQLPIVYTEVQYLTSSVPRQAFAKITFFITVYMTVERCLCVAFPLRIKQIITTRKTTITLILIYCFVIMCIVPIYVTYRLGWKFHLQLNATVFGLIATTRNQAGNAAVYSIHTVTGILAFCTVVILTTILISKLKEKSTWRKTANVLQEKSSSLSNRDRKTMGMVVIIASVLIICETPSTLLGVATAVEPEFAIGRKYYTLYSFFWSMAFILENINSSVNIFLYLKMSSKYREQFKDIFLRFQQKKIP